jgi:hypothetical protein
MLRTCSDVPIGPWAGTKAVEEGVGSGCVAVLWSEEEKRTTKSLCLGTAEADACDTTRAGIDVREEAPPLPPLIATPLGSAVSMHGALLLLVVVTSAVLL